jgi:hypothetical protein
VVTRSFWSFCYVEDPDRTSGIKVITAGVSPVEGATPSILAQLATVNGERILDYAVWKPMGTAAIPDTLGINNRTAAEILPWGLLVTVWGKASVPQGATDTFTISDGSSTPITVKLYGLTIPLDGQFVIYTGVLGAGPTLFVK